VQVVPVPGGVQLVPVPGGVQLLPVRGGVVTPLPVLRRAGDAAHAGRDPDRHDHLVPMRADEPPVAPKRAKGTTPPAWATPDTLPPAAAKPAATKAVFAVHSAHGRMGNSQLMVMRGVAVREKPARDVPSTGRDANITGSAGSGKS
jgi:hypothetical protein